MIPNEVIVDLGAIRDNFQAIRALAGHGSQIMAVVKADAYGHGMVPVARILQSSGVDYLGVFELEEGMELRAAGIHVPVLIMMGISSQEVEGAIDNKLTVALFEQDTAKRLSEKSLEQGTATPVHIKVDTGMTRLGVPCEQIGDFLRCLLSLKGLRPEGIFSHLATADQPLHAFTDYQIRSFLAAVEECRRLGVCTDAVHLPNSGALLEKKALDLLMARPGILLYGSPPAGDLKAPSFRPAMTFKSKIIQVREVPSGTPISYGCTYRTPSRSTIATIPVGYDDGYSRLLSNRGEVLVHGRRVPVVGRVCMNLTMLDVTPVEGVAVGDEVVLLGAQGAERITAEEVAERSGTISYEVYCRIGKNNRRVYIDP
jgi:alanine racemase